MKIILVNYLKLDELPPAISLLKIIDRFGGTYISLYNEEEYKSKFKNISFLSAYTDGFEFNGKNNFIEKIKYKGEQIHQYFAKKKIFKCIDSQIDEETLVWFLHESTVLSLGNKVTKYKHYFVTLFELDSAQHDSKGILSNICKKADKVVVPEEMRSHIVRAFLELQERPYVIHNKPTLIPENTLPENVCAAIEKLEKMKAKGNKIFIYAGIFIPERRLNEIIEAFDRIPNAVLVLMGRESYYLNDLKEKYKDKFVYLGFFTPPFHLKIIESADVGILSYISQNKSLNALFCAPNKIFEYGYYGLPILGNDIPGLKYNIESEKIGYCFDQENINSIQDAIVNVMDNYALYSNNIKKYVNSVDVEKEVLQLINEYI